MTNDTQQNRLPGVYATRGRRRALAIGGAAVLVLLWADVVLVWNLAPSDTARNVTLALLALGVAVFIALAVLLNLAIHGPGPRRKDQVVDERQRAEQRGAYATAHKVTTAVMIGVFVLLVGGVNAPDQEITVPIAAFSVFALALVATHGFLPMLIATWRLPDPPPDDEP